MVRVATAQFELGKDIDRVMGDIQRLADEAAAGGAKLVLFQECCNYPTSFKDRMEAWETSITIPGDMFNTLAAKAREHAMFIGFNASVKAEAPSAYMVNHLIGPDGAYIGSNKKQVLMFLEHDAYIPSDEIGKVFDTEIGRIGMVSCMDGLIPETSRTMACLGADIVLNSLCSNALDEARLHIPARAAENGYYMISSNRVGDMVQGQDLQDLMDAAGMTREFVAGAGESQISGPDGNLLARGSLDKVEVIFADLDLSKLERDDRTSRRRPELYGLMAEDTNRVVASWEGRAEPAAAAKFAAFVPTIGEPAAMLAEAVAAVTASDADLIVLPEYFAWKTADMQAGQINQSCIDAVTEALVAACAGKTITVVAGLPKLVDGKVANAALLLNADGVIGEYLQIHRDPTINQAVLGDDLPIFDLPFGRLGMLLGEDLLFPEAARVLALKGVDVIACPANWRKDWHYDLMLTERSAENHITIIAPSRADAHVPKPATICTTPPVYRFPDTKEVNNPDPHIASELTGYFADSIDLRANRDKRLMGMTDLLTDRRPELYQPIIATV
jgi:predicted amidohydrolase